MITFGSLIAHLREEHSSNMRHYIAYNKVAEWGTIGPKVEAFNQFSNHPYSRLKPSIGQRAWSVSGERIHGRMYYRLHYTFQPEEIIDEDGGGYRIFGYVDHEFDQPVLLNELPWFSLLFREQNNFSFGFNEIKHPEIIAGLQYLRQHPPQTPKWLESVWGEDVTDLPRTLPEGAVRRVMVNAYERNAKARQICLKHHGTACCICGFDFERRYGEMGRGIIQVHHLKPLSKIRGRYEVDPIEDLRPVCPNCHTMLHANPKQILTIAELKKQVRKSYV